MGTSTLEVDPAKTLFGTPMPQTITYGTASITVTGGLAYYDENDNQEPIPDGAKVELTLNDDTESGFVDSTNVTNGAGGFSVTFNTSQLPASDQPYDVTLNYAGGRNFLPTSDTSAILLVNRATPNFSNLTIDPKITYGDQTTTTISGHLNANAGQQMIPSGEPVQISIDDGAPVFTDLDANDDFQIPNFNISSLNASNTSHTIAYSFYNAGGITGDQNFESAQATSQLTISPAQPTFVNLSNPAISYGTPTTKIEGQLIFGADDKPLPDGAPIQITFDGTPLGPVSTDANGDFSTDVDTAKLTAGKSYEIDFKYHDPANPNFADGVGTAQLTVEQVQPAFSALSSPTIVYGTASATIMGQLNTGAGQQSVPAGEAIQVTLNGVTKVATLDSNDEFAVAFSTSGLPALGAPYAINFSYGGDANFSDAIGSSTLVVTQGSTSGLTSFTNLSKPSVTYGTATASLTGQLSASGAFQTGESVQVTVNGQTQTAALTSNGVFSVQINTSQLAVGKYPVTLSYAGDTNLLGSTGTATLVVQQARTSINLDPPQSIVFGTSSATISGQVLASGQFGSGESVKVTLDGNSQIGTLSGNGTFSVTFNTSSLAVGNYPVQVTYAGDANLIGSSYSGPASLSVQAALAPQASLSFGGTTQSDQGATLSFGATPSGTPVTQVITVSNTGTAPLIVQPVTVPTGFSIVAGTDFTVNQVIAVGSSASVTIQLNASTVGTSSGAMTINDNDPTASTMTVNLIGTVTDNAPYNISLSNVTISDSTPVGSVVGTLASYDVDSNYGPQTYTYSLGTGGDNSAFTIVGDQLFTAVGLNALEQVYYHIQVTTTEVGNGLSFTKAFTVIVTPTVNNAPYAIGLAGNTVADNSSIGTTVGQLQSYDVDSSYGPQSFTYSLGTGGDNSAFLIQGNQLVTNSNLDSGIQKFYHIQVTSTEVSSGLSYTEALTVIVTPSKTHSPYAITLTNNTILDNVSVGSTVGVLGSYDVDSSHAPQTFTYSLGTGGDNAAFTISGNQLLTNAAFDSATQKYYHIQLSSNEVGSGMPAFTTTLTVIVEPAVNPANTVISNYSITDNLSVGAVVGTLSTYNDVGPFTYSLGSGGDNAAFQIIGNQLETNASLNALTQEYYHIQVTTLDQGGKSFTTPLTIIVTPGTSHSPYYIGLTNNSISDSATINTMVGRLDSYDVDSAFGPQTFTYTLGTGGDNAAFQVVGNKLEVATALDAATQKFYQIQVSSTEVGSGMPAYTTTLTVIVTPSGTNSHNPYAIALDNTKIPDSATSTEGNPYVVGNLQTYDIDSNVGHPTFSYSLGVGGDNSDFAINGSQLVLATNVTLNASKQTYYHILVTSTEVGTTSLLTSTLTVIVTHSGPVVVPPTVDLSNNSLAVSSVIDPGDSLLSWTEQS